MSIESDPQPLREPTFLILLSLAPGLKHGYAILKDVEELSQGKARLSTGTLYEALARLLEQGWIERVVAAAETVEQRPRKVYRLSGPGRQALEAEISRMQRLMTTAARQLRTEDA
jgi:DNA-binding PadR family transcriptional regulator